MTDTKEKPEVITQRTLRMVQGCLKCYWDMVGSLHEQVANGATIEDGPLKLPVKPAEHPADR